MACVVKQRSNGRYQARVDAPGQPSVYRTLPDEASAQAWATATLASVLSGGLLPLKPHGRALVRVVLARYETDELPKQKSRKSSVSRIKTLVRLLGDFTLPELTIEVLENFKLIRMGAGSRVHDGVLHETRATQYRLKGRAKRLEKAAELETRTVSSQSCRHELMLLQRAVKWWSYLHGLALEKRGHPLFEVKLPAKSDARERRFREGEEERILAALGEGSKLAPPLRFALETAMRREELCGARWENLSIEADSGLLWIDDTKHPDSAVRQGRFVSLSPVAIELLREIGIEDDGLIFDVQPDSLTQAFGRARERAGLEGIRLGDTRREAASRKAEDGWTLPMVMAFTGHKDVRTLAGIYLRLRAKLLSQRMHGTSPADSRPGTWD